ncbi:hypothetical protein V8D89_007057 [Ganoderma adspersum]
MSAPPWCPARPSRGYEAAPRESSEGHSDMELNTLLKPALHTKAPSTKANILDLLFKAFALSTWLLAMDLLYSVSVPAATSPPHDPCHASAGTAVILVRCGVIFVVSPFVLSLCAFALLAELEIG